MITNLVNIANSGHSVSIESASDQLTDRAHERLNEQARNLSRNTAGIDGLINHYIEEIAITGAISAGGDGAADKIKSFLAG